MPGLSFVCNLKGGLRKELDRIDHSLQTLICAAYYSSEFLLETDQFVLVCSGYPEYPVRKLELADYTVVFEGRLYSPSSNAMSDEMEKLSRILFEEKEDNSARLKTLGLNTDGDFVIFILKKSTHQIRILNDFLGRLPCYWYKQGGVFMLSRELRFIANLIGNRKYDRMGIAQCLLFGYPLADRMLLEGVQRLRPATLVRINFASLETSMESLHTFNFDSKEHAHRTVQENSAELVRLFRESCRQRACATGHNVVSLGGGLDSRSVAAGLSEERLPFLAVTFLNHDRSMSSVRVGGVKKQN